jgi:hypothetical protein
LEETEHLEGLALLGVDLVDTLDADDEGEARLGRYVVGAFLLGDAREADLLALCIAVLLDIGFGALENLLTLLLGGLFGIVSANSNGNSLDVRCVLSVQTRKMV